MFYVKTILGSDIRRFALALPDFNVLESVLQATYGKPGVPFTVRYEDDDGDIISVSSNAELEEAVKCKAPKTLVFRVFPVDAPQTPSAGQSDCEIVSLPSSPSLPPETGDWNICDDLESNEPQTPSQQEVEQKETETPVVEVVVGHSPSAEEIAEAAAAAKQHRKALKFAKKLAKHKACKKEREQPQPPVCANKPVVHSNVRCDNCRAFPVVGDRYKCTVCDDYDLCAACEAQGSHSANHPFVKFKLPEVTRHEGVQCDDCGVFPIAGDRFKCMVCPQYDLCEKCEAKRLHDVTHPLVKLRVEMSSLAPALVAAASVADADGVKVVEIPEAEAEGKDAKREARRAGKKEARRKEKEAKKAEKAERKAKKEAEAAEAQVVQPEQPVSPVASVAVDSKVEAPFQVDQTEPVIPLAMPVSPPAESLLAPELEEKLQILEALGFSDRQHMCLLLSRFDGDLQRVADALLFV